MVQLANTLPSAAVARMTTRPSERAVTRPVSSTDATAVVRLCQVTSWPSLTRAVSCSVSPAAMTADVWLRVISGVSAFSSARAAGHSSAALSAAASKSAAILLTIFMGCSSSFVSCPRFFQCENAETGDSCRPSPARFKSILLNKITSGAWCSTPPARTAARCPPT